MEATEDIGCAEIEVVGARTHNLKNIHVTIPRDKLVVITGVSGSGKSSLAFDTIFAEGQRRYLETFSAYARQFIGELERPDVDIINGLSPVISIDQKTTSKNLRSTVGTITDIYDFLRLLFARASTAFSYLTGAEMLSQSEEEIQSSILAAFGTKPTIIIASLVRQRKGHYRELFESMIKYGYSKARIDGVIKDLRPKMQLDRYATHNIELVIDSLIPESDLKRFENSLKSAFKFGNGLVGVLLQSSSPKTSDSVSWYCKTLMEVSTGLSYSMPEPNTFSFNSPVGSCPGCSGVGEVKILDLNKIIIDPSKPLLHGGWAFEEEDSYIHYHYVSVLVSEIKAVAKRHKIKLEKPFAELPTEHQDILLRGEDEQEDITTKAKRKELDISELIRFFEKNTFPGILQMITKFCLYGGSIETYFSKYFDVVKCPECAGTRLKKESLSFKIDQKNIGEIAALDMQKLMNWLSELPAKLSKSHATIADPVLKEIRKRVQFLLDVGLDYLSLNRPAGTLSGGESQRIRLATQIGTQLSGVLYILDEPSIGLHQKDNMRLINSLKSLRDLGNSILVVEHDKEIMLESDYIIDVGPGAGKNGGNIINVGDKTTFCAQAGITADYLSGRQQIQVPKIRRTGNGYFLTLSGATGHNLKDITLKLPLGMFVCVTGVSGSGKSTIIRHTLYPILHEHVFKHPKPILPFKEISGLEYINKVIEIDQSPIGKTPRSNPATYTKLFDEIRSFFALLPESQIRGYKPGRFSFNIKGGRCEECSGGGKKVIEMGFLPDVLVECPKCRGKRYNRETLEVRYKGKSINDVLEMSVEQALTFFEAHPKIKQVLQTLYDVGLGYITLGQSSTTLSGGEAQRVKVATELTKRDTGKTIYILDEPTTGLHFQDIENLLNVLNRLVGKGNTVLVIEHNLDVIKIADWIIDMGPYGGERGGYIIAEGTPEDIAQNDASETGKYLVKELNTN
ncbi:MAG: excinuclease ABC subunit UvrA [Bacteroidia bacterium]|nr:excinuclease ABC subunit UvrA [Bacteroidia bacterium]